MMAHILDDLGKASFSDFVFLCGAGISLDAPTSLPTVYRFINDLIDHCAGTTKKAASLKEKVRKSVWRTENPVRYRFELLIDFIRRNYDQELAVGEIFSSDAYNENHYFLARMLAQGACVITTNFDCCIENALENGASVHRYVFRGLSTDLPENPSTQSALVKIHGSLGFEQRSELIITLTSLARTNNGFRLFPQWRAYLKELLRDKILIVLGYSGSDDFDVTPLLLDASPKSCLWVQFKQGVDMPQPLAKEEMKLPNARLEQIRNVHFYEGNPTALGRAILQSDLKKAASSLGDTPKIKTYVETLYATPIRKRELLNTVLFHYDLHNEVIKGNKATNSDLIFFQCIQSLYRKGDYGAIVERIQNSGQWIGKKTDEIEPYLLTDLLFHYSAALYYANGSAEAIVQAKKMYEVARKTKNRFSQMDALTHLAALKVNLWEFETAQRYYNKVLRLERFSPNLENKARANWGLADILSFAGQHQRALKKYKKVYTVYANIGSNFIMAQLEYNIGIAYLKMHAFRDAEAYFLLSERRYRDVIRETNRAEKNLIYTLYGMAQMYIKTNELKKGKERITETLRYINDCPGHPLYYETITLYLYLTYLRNGLAGLQDSLSNVKKRFTLDIQTQNGFEKNCLFFLQKMLDDHSSNNLVSQMKEIEKFYEVL